MGFNIAPMLFTSIDHTVSSYLHTVGISVLPYLDDWLIHTNRSTLWSHRDKILETFQTLGFIVNHKKPQLKPSQEIEFLGVNLNLRLGTAALPRKKAINLVKKLKQFPNQKIISYKQTASVMGSLNWASALIVLGKLQLRPIQRLMYRLGLCLKTCPPIPVRDNSLSSLLKRGMVKNWLMSGISLKEIQKDITVFTDASHQGWGHT